MKKRIHEVMYDTGVYTITFAREDLHANYFILDTHSGQWEVKVTHSAHIWYREVEAEQWIYAESL